MRREMTHVILHGVPNRLSEPMPADRGRTAGAAARQRDRRRKDAS